MTIVPNPSSKINFKIHTSATHTAFKLYSYTASTTLRLYGSILFSAIFNLFIIFLIQNFKADYFGG